MAVLRAHFDSCEECRKALMEHDERFPRCGDEACLRTALCPEGTALRADYWDSAYQ